MKKTNRSPQKIGLVLFSALVVTFAGYAANDDRPRTTGAVSQRNGTNTQTASAVEQYYPVDSGGHWIDFVMERGAKVRLEDGSVWEIAAKDQFQTRDWRVAQKISVSRNPNERTPFKLTNIDKKASADARLGSRLK